MPKARRLEQAVEFSCGHLHESLRIASPVEVLQGTIFIEAQSRGRVIVAVGLAGESLDRLAFLVGGGCDVHAAVGQHGGPNFIATDDEIGHYIFREFRQG